MDEGPPMSGGPWGGCQVGCEANRLQKLIDKGRASRTPDQCSYELTQFCNMHRTEEWRDLKEPPYIENAREEITLSFGVIIEDDPNKPFSDLEKTVMSLRKLDYDKENIKIVISTDNNRDVAQLVGLVHSAQEYIKDVEFIAHLHEIKPLKDKECFQKVVNYNFFVRVEAGAEVSTHEFANIESVINDDLKQVSMFKNKGGITYCPSSVVRSLYLNYNDYELMISDLENISKEQEMYQDLV